MIPIPPLDYAAVFITALIAGIMIGILIGITITPPDLQDLKKIAFYQPSEGGTQIPPYVLSFR